MNQRRLVFSSSFRRCGLLTCFIDHLSAGGVISVVMTTMMTTAPNVARANDRAPRAVRGRKNERRTNAREDQPDLAARDHTWPDRHAVDAAPNHAERACLLAYDGRRRQSECEPDNLGAPPNARRSTLRPIRTKKTGTSNALTGASSSASVRSPRSANDSK